MANLSNINNKFLVTTGGNVLINKTAANNATVGTQIMSTGDINPTVSGDTVARFNRLGTDGEIIRFQHDTSTDGAINSLSGRIAIGSSNTGIFFDSIRQVITPWDITDNDNEFNNISFGRSIVRFKDIYLSGKVVAGTGSTDAATINAFSTTVSAGLHSALRIIENTTASSYWDIGATNGASTILNFYHNGTTTPKITFTHLGGATFAGDVGIGTTLPLEKLHVNGGNINIQNVDSSSPYTASGKLRFLGRYDRYLGGVNTVNTGSYAEYDNGLDFYVQRDTFNAAGHFAMRINHLGNVGIGTDSPTSKLHLRDPGTNSDVGIKIGNDSRDWNLKVMGSVSDSLQFFTHDNSNVMTILPSGNVGIGTASPEAKLDISNVAGATYALEISTPERNRALFFYNSASVSDAGYLGIKRGSVDALNHRFATTGNSAVCIEEGNFGIGTDSPSEILHINGGGSGPEIRLQGTWGSHYIRAYNDNWNFLVGGTVQAINIKNNGNVGIGTTSAAAKLEVNTQGGGVGGYTGFKLKYGTSSVQSLYMGQVTAGNGAFVGTAQYRNAGYWQTEGTASSVINMDAAGNMGFYTNSGLTANTDFNISERMRITSGGNVAIGGTLGADSQFRVEFKPAGTILAGLRIGYNGTSYNYFDGDNQYFRNGLGSINRMVITSGGRVLINNTNTSNDAMCHIGGNASNYALYLYADVIYASNYRYQRFRSGGNIAGGIEGINQTSVTYNTSSDYRMKKNIKPLENGLERLSKLKPVKFDWKLNDESTEGFIAHEVQEIFPDAISGEKDGEEMQGMDYGRITPLLVAAIQELKAEIELLKSK